MEALLRYAAFLIYFANSIASARPLQIPVHSSVVNLNPLKVQDSWSLWVSRQVNCQLLRTSAGDIQNDAAESIRFLNPTKIEIKLKDQKFSDGSPVTAADVVATLDWYKRNRNIFRDVLENVGSVSAVGDKVVVLNLKKENQGFLRSFAAPNYGIYPASFLKSASDASWLSPTGCGKYRVARYVPGEHRLTLSQIGKGSDLVFHLLEGSSLTSEEAQNYDLIPRPFQTALGNLKGFKTVSSFDPKQVYLSINASLPRWKSKSVRCSFLNSFDKSPLLKAYGTQAEASDQIFPRGVIGYDGSIAAKGLKAGPTFSGLSSACISFLGLSVPEDLRESYVETLKKEFTNLRTEVIENPVNFGGQFKQSKCDFLISGFKSNFLDGYEFLIPFVEPTVSITAISSPKLVKQVKESQLVYDVESRSREYQRVQRSILDDCLVKPIVTIPHQTLLIKNNLQMSGIGSVPLSEYDLSGVL